MAEWLGHLDFITSFDLIYKCAAFNGPNILNPNLQHFAHVDGRAINEIWTLRQLQNYFAPREYSICPYNNGWIIFLRSANHTTNLFDIVGLNIAIQNQPGLLYLTELQISSFVKNTTGKTNLIHILDDTLVIKDIRV